MKEIIYDIAINGGTICAFSPDVFEKYNIGIRSGKIDIITKKTINGIETIDATGKIVAPGFIDFHSHVDGKQFSGLCMLKQGATTTIGGERPHDGIRTRIIFENGFVLNQGYYVSHSFALRNAVGIEDVYREAKEEELVVMEQLADEFLCNGAFGIHFALELVPGTSEDEILCMAEIAKKYGRPLIFHVRKDGKEGLGAVKEILRIARKANVSVHILHLEYMVGYADNMVKTLKIINEAISDGVDVSADTGLYSAFPTSIGAPILDEGWMNKYRKGTTYRNLVISSGIFTGRECNRENFYYIRDNYPNTLVTAFVLDEEPIAQALVKDFVYVSTNGADGPHYFNMGHPETAGTFPRLIRKYVREERLIDLPNAIKKITYQPATRFHINNKGNIKKGYDADIVIFDYDNIYDCAVFANKGDPNENPKGIECVIVNGKIVIKDEWFLGNMNAGKLITAGFL